MRQPLTTNKPIQFDDSPTTSSNRFNKLMSIENKIGRRFETSGRSACDWFIFDFDKTTVRGTKKNWNKEALMKHRIANYLANNVEQKKVDKKVRTDSFMC